MKNKIEVVGSGCNKKKNKNFSKFFYHTLMPKIYGWGAAVVIIGAMFKLLNLEGASTMLAVGLSTEAILFILGSFEPAAKEYDWSIVYPELNGDCEVPKSNLVNRMEVQSEIISPVSNIGDLFLKEGLKKESLEKFNIGLERLIEYTDNISMLAKASTITAEYYSNMEKASSVISSINKIQEKISGSFSLVQEIEKGGEQYATKVNSILSLLDNVAELYKKESSLLESSISKKLNVLDNLVSLSEDSIKVQENVKNLRITLESLNTVYSKVLVAMKS